MFDLRHIIKNNNVIGSRRKKCGKTLNFKMKKWSDWETESQTLFIKRTLCQQYTVILFF